MGRHTDAATHIYVTAMRKLKQFTYAQLADEVNVNEQMARQSMIYFIRTQQATRIGDGMFKFNENVNVDPKAPRFD